MARKSRRGNKFRITRDQRESILQTYLLTGSKLETARRLDLSDQTVRRHLKEIGAEMNDPDLAIARKQASIQLANKVQDKAVLIFDSVGPKDLETGFTPVLNRHGEVVGQRAYGPSLLQKVTAGAIMVDKVKVLQETAQAFIQTEQTAENLMPGSIGGLLRGIQGKLKSLNVLQVNFEQEKPGITDRIQEAVTRAADVEDIEYIDLTDFDGN